MADEINSSEAFNVLSFLRDVETHPWVQAVVNHYVPDGQFLATIYKLADRAVSNATPIDRLPPPADMRAVFR